MVAGFAYVFLVMLVLVVLFISLLVKLEWNERGYQRKREAEIVKELLELGGMKKVEQTANNAWEQFVEIHPDVKDDLFFKRKFFIGYRERVNKWA